MAIAKTIDLDAARAAGMGQPHPDAQPTPLGPDLPQVPPFDLDLLPDRMRPWVADIADRMQAPTDFPAAAAVVAAGGCLGRRLGVKPQEYTDWVETPNVWGAIVARPSAMKSPTMAAGFAPMRKLEITAGEKHAEAMREWSKSAKEYELREKVAAEIIKKALKAEMEGRAAPKKATIPDLTPPEKPARKRFLVTDATYEKAGEIMADNPDGITILRDELSGFLRPLSKEENAPARAFWLESWTGTGHYTFDRIGRGTIAVQCCASVFGAIQPGKLSSYLRAAIEGGDGDDGMMQRFGVIVYPDISSDWKDVDRWPDRHARTEYSEIFERLATIEAASVGAAVEEFDQIPSLRLSREALLQFRDWRSGTLEPMLRGGDLHPALESHFGKYRTLVPVLALIFHLIDCEEGGPVSGMAMARSLAWSDYLSAHARRVYGSVTLAERTGARVIWKRLKSGALTSPFAVRDIQQKGWTGLGDAEAVRAALEVLLNHNLVFSETIPASKTGGRPAERFAIHPGAAHL